MNGGNGGGWGERFNSWCRGIVTVSITWTFCYIVVRNSEKLDIDWASVMTIVTAVITAWFSTRQMARDVKEAISSAVSPAVAVAPPPPTPPTPPDAIPPLKG